jgi:hypothetical protein
MFGILTTTACSSPSGKLAGNWSGQLASSIAGTGNVAASLTQDGSKVGGTWSSTFANPSNNNSGTVKGSISGSSVSLTLTSGNAFACGSQVTSTLSGNTLAGTYTTVNCSVADGGVFQLSKF